MKKFAILSLLFMCCLATSACSGDGPESSPTSNDKETEEGADVYGQSISMTIGEKTLKAVLYDNAAGKDFYSRLPLDITLEDYNNTTEKIFHPDPELNITGVERGFSPIPGDIAIYVPWGNVCIFCKNWRYSDDLIKIGHISDDGIKALSIPGNLKVRIDKTGSDGKNP